MSKQNLTKEFRFPFLFLLVTVLSIFIAEVIVMSLVMTFIYPSHSHSKLILFDSLALTMVLIPQLYFFLYKPLRVTISKLKDAEFELQKNNDLLEIKVRERTNALEESNRKLGEALKETVNALVTVGEKRDPYTAGHQHRVALLSKAIGEELELSQKRLEALFFAGTLHDIGKIYIPSDILNKPGRLTDIEFNLIKTHPEISHDIIKRVPFELPVAEIVIQHHERLDGSGYPKGLKGEEICLEARILAVADVVEAMASHRPYRPAIGLDKAIEEIKEHVDTYYDSQVVDACVRLITEKGFAFN